MNFLAHCALAQDTAQVWDCNEQQHKGLLAGAIVGDFVKGRVPEHWPIELQAGVKLHRKIDAWSNQHPGIRNSCNRFPKSSRRFAPIYVDLLADYCLSLSWGSYYTNHLSSFTAQCYSAVRTYDTFLPDHGLRFLTYMEEQDLLANYDDWRHIKRGLAAVLRRLQRSELLAAAEQANLEVLSGVQEDFVLFYPDLRSIGLQWNVFTP